MKILNTEQIRQLDQYTIEQEPIPSIELMERASKTFVKWFQKKYPDTRRKVYVFCGPGNNGGDGLAVARMLSRDFYEVSAFLLKIGPNLSEGCQLNLKTLKKQRSCHLEILEEGATLPDLPTNSIVIDAIFGSGLTRPLTGWIASAIEHLNRQPVTRLAIDIPSGMFAARPSEGVSILADATFSFEMPKLGFFFEENSQRVGEWDFGTIGLNATLMEKENTPWHFLEKNVIKPLLKKRGRHDHKGTHGHALLVAGSYGKIGAAILAAKACYRSGAGLVTIHAPKCGYQILQIALPEAMVSVDEHEFAVSGVNEDISAYKAIGIGCGIGRNELTIKALTELFEAIKQPVVLDADALNILSEHPVIFKKLPPNSILTPHPKEFERLFGATSDSFSRNELQRKKAQELQCHIILKGAFTCIADPEGNCWFNGTGNPGMATGGSGDVLTGILTGLLAQGYPPLDASLLGVWLHGLSGDLAAQDLQQEALLAGDIIDHLGKAFIEIKNEK